MKTTIAEMYLNGGYDNLIEMTIYACECKKITLPLDDYVPSIDGDLDEYCEDWLIHQYAEDYSRIETIDNNLVLIEEPDNKCYDCANGKTYMKDMPRPVGFEDVYKMHGIIAYLRNDYTQAKEHLNKVLTNNNYETCCSTEALGMVGVVLDGTVICASNCDLGSKVDSNGRYYYAHSDEAQYIINNADDMTFGTDGMNDEIVTIDNTLVAVWYKEHANNEEKELARELAEYYGVELIEEPMTEADKEDLENMEKEDWMF